VGTLVEIFTQQKPIPLPSSSRLQDYGMNGKVSKYAAQKKAAEARKTQKVRRYQGYQASNQ